MKYASFILVALLATLAGVTYFLRDPIIFVVGLFLIPNVIQCLPWMLAAPEEPEEDDEPKAGFHADL